MNLEWAKKWMGSYNPKGLDYVVEQYAVDVKFEDLTLGDKANGKEELKAAFKGFLTGPGTGEYEFSVTSYTGNSDGGAAEWTWHAKHSADFLGARAAGKETTVRGVSILTFRGGKISSQRDYWDSAALLRQLGAIK
jgi:steroid delta-isomerase-like uncharacterized protein